MRGEGNTIKKKRILINVMLFGPGGGATHLLYLCTALVKAGADVTLVSRYAHATTPLLKVHKEIPIRLITTPFARNRRLYRLSTIWALVVWPFLLRGRSYDLLYTWEISTFTRFLSLFVRPQGRVLLQRTGEPLSDDACFDPSLEKLLDGLVVETALHAAAARRVLTRNISILALPHMGHCFSAPARNGNRPNEVFQITFLGRYHRDKGIYRLLDIWPKLNVRKAELKFYAWGAEQEQLRSLIHELGFEGQIQLHAAYSTAEELTEILAKTDLVVLPSETEGLPVVLLEAMAHGVPFVAADVGTVRLLAEDNPDVRVVPLENQALKQAIEEMVSAIRLGTVKSDRLQTYYRARYGHDQLCQQWTDALLNPERPGPGK